MSCLDILAYCSDGWQDMSLTRRPPVNVEFIVDSSS